jgi:hypothetical protein
VSTFDSIPGAPGAPGEIPPGPDTIPVPDENPPGPTPPERAAHSG